MEGSEDFEAVAVAHEGVDGFDGDIESIEIGDEEVGFVAEDEEEVGGERGLEGEEGGAVDEGAEGLGDGAEAEEGLHGEVGEDEEDEFQRKIRHG